MTSALSPQNARIARAHALLDGRGRREAQRFLVEGPTLIEEARGSGLAIQTLFATPQAAARHPALVAQLEAAGTAAFTVPEKTITRLSDLTSPPGLIAEISLPSIAPAGVFARPGAILLLAGVSDPGNAGTLIRSAEAFGLAGVLVAHGGVDPYSPKVVRAAMGSLFRLPLALVGPQEAVDAAAAHGRSIVAADGSGEPLSSAELPAGAVIAVGNERHGVSAFLPHWDRAVRVEQPGVTESLNAAVAGSILLYIWSRRVEKSSLGGLLHRRYTAHKIRRKT